MPGTSTRSTEYPRSAQYEVRPPALGAVRLPGPRLHNLHESAVDLVATAVELRPLLGTPTLEVAAVLADSVVEVVREIVGHDLSSYRSLFCEAGHFGGLLAAAEEHQVRSPHGRMAPHAAELLACVGAEFDEDDQLAEQMCRWLLESGYFLVRSGTPTGPLVASLRADLTRLLALVEADADTDTDAPEATTPDAVEELAVVAVAAPTPRLPRPAVSPEAMRRELVAGA